MLDICTMFADACNTLFNPAKSQCIRFCRLAIPTLQFPVQLQAVALIWTNHLVYLGQVLCYNLDGTDDIKARIKAFYSQANCFLTRFQHLTLALKSQLFQTYYRCFYGSQLWDFNCVSLNKLILIYCDA